MPNDPPPICPQSFLDAVSACSWADNHLLDASSVAQWPVPISGAWTLTTSFARTLSESSFMHLHGATSSGGGFVSGGVNGELVDTGTAAVAQPA